MERNEFQFSHHSDKTGLDSLSLHISPNSSGISDYIYGDIDFCNLTLRGLSTIGNDFDLPAFQDGLTQDVGVIKFKLNSGTLSIDGKQDLNVTFLPGIISDGGYAAITENFFFRLNNVELSLNVRVENLFSTFDLTLFELDLVLPLAEDNFAVTINLGDGLLGGEPMTDERWRLISGVLTQVANTLWFSFEDPLNDYLTVTVADLVQDCTMLDFVAGDFSCIGGGSERKEAGLEELLWSAVSKLVTIGESDICPGEGDHGTGTPPIDDSTLPTTVDPPSATSVDPNPGPVPEQGDVINNNIFVLNDVNFTNVNFTINID